MAAKSKSGIETARRLRELRERLGVPKERVALAFGMSAENWRHYESGRNQLAATMLPTLAELYGMTLAELVTELLEKPPDADTLGRDEDSRLLAKQQHNLALYLDWTQAPTPDAPWNPASASRELVAAGR